MFAHIAQHKYLTILKGIESLLDTYQWEHCQHMPGATAYLIVVIKLNIVFNNIVYDYEYNQQSDQLITMYTRIVSHGYKSSIITAYLIIMYASAQMCKNSTQKDSVPAMQG